MTPPASLTQRRGCLSRLATWYLPKIPQALSAPSWPRRAPASLSQGRGRTQLASTEHPSLISSTPGPAALLADPDPWTNLTSCFSASTGLSAPLCSGPLHELCSVSTTLSHTPDTAHLWFILRSGQMSSPERDLSHLTRGPHGPPAVPDTSVAQDVAHVPMRTQRPAGKAPQRAHLLTTQASACLTC